MGENVSRLVLHWMAGWPYAPVQRWCIYEVQPHAAVAKMLEIERLKAIERGDDARDYTMHRLWSALQGDDPRGPQGGRWVKHKDVGKRWLSKSMVSQAQWKVHRQTGGYPTLCWIVEGLGGGHAWQFGQLERHFLMATIGDPSLVQEMAEAWPNPGSQSYADYDNRVFEALRERDQLGQWRNALRWDERVERQTAADLQDFEANTRHEQMAQRMMVWMNNQIGDAVSDIPRRLLPQWSDFQSVDGPASNEDQAIADLIKG
jgi:hypothetical protein